MKKIKIKTRKMPVSYWSCKDCGYDNELNDQYVQASPPEGFVESCDNCGKKSFLTTN